MPGRVERFARGGFEARSGGLRLWPIEPHLHIGQSVLTDRDGTGRPHHGVDLFAEAGTPVRAAQGGRVLRVIDGRGSKQSHLRRAGLFVDVQGEDDYVYRYLHLAEARVAAGQRIKKGVLLGTVAAPFTSGLRNAPHLHFEVRLGDYSRETRSYGAAVDPLLLLPPRRA